VKPVTYRDPGVRVLVNEGMSRGSKGITTGDTQPTEYEGLMLVGVQLSHRFRFIREDFLEPEPFRAVLHSSDANDATKSKGSEE
jgi:hypothetical protein